MIEDRVLTDLHPLCALLVVDGLVIGRRPLTRGFEKQEIFVWILISGLNNKIAPE